MKIAVLLALCGTAAADEPHDAVSTQVTTLQREALNLQLDHDLGVHRLSLVAAAGVRNAAMGDFESWTYGLGIELRRWKSHAMRGWYGAVRADASITHLTDDMQKASLGNTLTTTVGAAVGYRFVVFHHAELTPSLGLAELFERTPMQPWATRPVIVVGLTAGAIF